MHKKQIKIAFDLVSKDLPLIPLKSNSKLPIMNNWTEKGSIEESTIEEWSQEYKGCNFGVITGNGLIVLDVDNKNNKEGSNTLSELGVIPNTYTVATPNGGFHYYYKSNSALKSRNFNNGLEIKSTGSQVVAAGSTIDEKEYEVINDAEFAEFPLELLEKLGNIKKQKNNDNEAVSVEAVIWDVEQKRALTSQLKTINPDLDYIAWLTVLYACLNIYGNHSEVWDLLKAWSAEGEKYNESDFWKKINTYNPNHQEKIGYPALKNVQWAHPIKHQSIAKNEFGTNLQQPILNKAITLLDTYGNIPSQHHINALQEITTTLAHAVDSHEKFRIAFPLETGMGKTTCVVALASELAKYDRGLLICAERIEQLVEMKVAMVNAGVDDTKIGIHHKSDLDTPSITLEEMHNYQYLLVTHARVKIDSQNKVAENLLRYKNNKRSLTIWDESLITTQSYYCPLPEMICAIRDWISRFEVKLGVKKSSNYDTDEYQSLYSYFKSVIDLLDGEMEDGNKISLPYIFLDKHHRDLINNIMQNEDYKGCLETLITFIQLGEVRVVKAKDGSIFMQFAQVIDDCFDKVIVMDASCQIRALLNFDKTVSVHSLGVNKDYAEVEIFQADIRSSKSSFSEDRHHLKKYLKELAQLIDNIIPKTEALIVFCHKEQKDEISKWAEESYPSREIHTLNWGEHRASNKYSKVKFIVTLGVMYRDWKQISSSIIAQTRSLDYKLLDMDVNHTYYSEQAEMLYQGFSRGNCRNTSEGKAGKQVIYLFHPNEDYAKVMESLRKVMPNIKELKYKPEHLIEGRKNAKDYNELATLIIDYLVSLELPVLTIAKSALIKHVAPHLTSNSKTWRKAIEKVKYEINGWVFNSKNVIRNT